MDEFTRTELLIGPENMEKLKSFAVAVFGIGGVGSHCAEALARGGIGRLILIDSDRVALSNINRQSIAYHSTVGRYKTQVMRERILDINPAAAVSTFETFVLKDNLEEILNPIAGKLNYIVDAVDTVTAKLALAAYAKAHAIPIIASMGTGNKLHPEQFVVTDIAKTSVCPLCKVMRRELKKRGIDHLKVLYSEEIPLTPQEGGEESASGRPVPGSVSFVPPVAGIMMAGEVIRDLAGL